MNKTIVVITTFLICFSSISQEIKYIPGATDFNIADKLAITDVINAYGIYWDTNQMEQWALLFTENAKGVVFDNNFERSEFNILSQEQIASSKDRQDYFLINQMQRRHIMANTHFLVLNKDYAAVTQYMLLVSTEKKKTTEIVTPIKYDFKFVKVDGIWKIDFRQINIDKPVDLNLSYKK